MKRLIKGRVNIGQESYTPLAYVNQLDNITLELNIYSGDTPLNVTGQTVSLYAKRSNKTVVEQLEGFSIETSKVTGDVKNSCFAVPGITEMQLELTDSNGKTTVSSFYVHVNKSLSSEDSITANNEIGILTEAKEQEPIRQRNETERIKNETARGQAETNRAAAEEIREQQELARQTCYKEIEESRMDFDGGIHKNLKLRLMRDLGDIYERFNKANLLPYEAEYISASNSYKGMTRDNVVKGKTLQNLNEFGKSLTLKKGAKSFNGSLFIVNKEYTFITDISPYVGDGNVGGYAFDITYVDDTYDRIYNVSSWSNNEVKIREKLVIKKQVKTITCWNKSTNDITFTNNLILEGDYTNKPIPSYFEGIKSVNEDGENLVEVSCGKNLFDEFVPMTTISTGVTYEKLENGFKITSLSQSVAYSAISRKVPIGKFLGRTVTFYADMVQTASGAVAQIMYKDISGKYMYHDFSNAKMTIEFPSSIADDYLIFRMIVNNTSTPNIANTATFTNIQFEYGSEKTPYEPYVEDRLPIKMKNLRSLPNGTCDTSDGVRRIGKVVFDGSDDEGWVKDTGISDGNLCTRFKTSFISSSASGFCDKFLVRGNAGHGDYEYIALIDNISIYINILKTKLSALTLLEFKRYLQTNPVTLYYQLKIPTQEENFMEQLRTYDGVTNIFTEGSIIEPTISCKVPSNVQAVVMSLREENEALNNDVNTLQATTEENNLMNIETNVNQEARLTMLELGVI